MPVTVMTKIRQNETEYKRVKQPPDLSQNSPSFLDTLEQLATINVDAGFRGSKKTLQKRARRKTIAKVLMNPLIELHSPLQKAYKLTSGFCVNTMRQDGTKITATYCGYRWCPVCNSIRTAKLLNGYTPAFQKMQDPHFVTLTAPTIPLVDLDQEISFRNKVFTEIRKYHQKGKERKQFAFELNGIRKLEVTPRPDNHAHPHYHIIIDGKESANFLVDQWLQRIPSATRSAQDIQKVDESGLIELFKYVTKFWSKDDGTGNPKMGTPYQMDQIYQALRRRRTIQPFGNVRAVSEEIEKLDSVDIEGITPKEGSATWEQPVYDWIDEDGELLSGYRPSARDLHLITIIKGEQSNDTG